jgi:hypothetical protein
MAKKKEQKKKERERRVAKKKLAAAEKRAQAQTTNDAEKKLPRAKKIMTGAALPKTNYVPTNKKSPFTHRRSGG